MVMSFRAFGGDAGRKADLLNRLAVPAEQTERHSFVEQVTGGESDYALAHKMTRFPSDLLEICNAIVEGFSVADSPAMVMELVSVPEPGSDLGNIAEIFVRQMFTHAVARCAVKALRQSAKDWQIPFWPLHQALNPTHQQIAKAKAAAKRVRRQGLDGQSPEKAFIEDATNLAMGDGVRGAGTAVRWILNVEEQADVAALTLAKLLIEILAQPEAFIVEHRH